MLCGVCSRPFRAIARAECSLAHCESSSTVRSCAPVGDWLRPVPAGATFQSTFAARWMSITFAKPPINEVVLGQVFSPRLDLLIPHFGRFWDCLGSDYPKVAHAQPIVDDQSAEPPADPTTGIFLPRVWFLSDDETRLVQLQQDRLFVNWRQTPEITATYPRFPSIWTEFERVSAIFEDFLSKNLNQPLAISRHELSYVNVISLRDAGIKGVEEFHKVFSCFKWDTKSVIEAPKKISVSYMFEPDTSTKLTVRINSAKRISDGEELLKMELIAREIPGMKERGQWIEDAHQLIVQSFKDLTAEEIHANQWQLVTG